MTCEICGTPTNVLSVVLWQREPHDYCAACAARVRPVPVNLSDTWKREFSSLSSLLVLPFYVCECGTPLTPLLRSACEHLDDYSSVGDLVEDRPRCQNCGDEFQLFVSDYACQTCGEICRPTFVTWQPDETQILASMDVPYGWKERLRRAFENPN